MNYKPFDLQKALAGDSVVTGTGLPVRQITFFKDMQNTYFPVVGVVGGHYLYAREDGTTGNEAGNKWGDLFMTLKPVEYWIATGCFKCDHDSLYSTNPCVNETIAREDLVNNNDIENSTIQTHKITRFE
jgi:hypothetical protein